VDEWTGLPFGQLSAGALVALIVLLILRGSLVTRRQLLDVMEDRDKWRTSSEDWQRSSTQLSMSVEKLVVLAETTNHALTEIQQLAARPGAPESAP